MGRWIRQAICTVSALAAGLAGVAWLVGCGMAAAPQPPSLHLPRQVTDLKAARRGNAAELSWISPKQTTDRLKLTGPVKFRICREQGNSGCQTVATTRGVPGKPANYTEQLPAALASGPLRPATYLVYALNAKDRSAGPANAATILLGTAPAAIQGLTASMTERGVLLRWQPLPAPAAGTQVQLHRTLVMPPGGARKNSSTPASAELPEQTLAVATDAGGKEPGVALDTNVQFDRIYRYTATRLVTRRVNKENLDAASAAGNAVTITTRDTFPPAPPGRLAAVPVSAALNGGTPEVDLSWSPNTEPDLAQYRVYRRQIGTQENPVRERLAPEKDAEPVVAPAFRDMHVQPGQTYSYTVTAVDAAGNESAPSAAVRVTLPGT